MKLTCRQQRRPVKPMHSNPPRSSKPIWLSEATRKQQWRPADMPRLACRQSPKALRCHCVTHLCSQQRNLKAGARHHKLLHRHGVARGDEQVLQQPSQGQAMWCLNDDDRGSAAQSEQPSHEAQDGSASTGGPAGRRAASRLQWACLAGAHPAVDGVQPDGAGLHLRVPLHRVDPVHCKGQAAPALSRQAQQAGGACSTSRQTAAAPAPAGINSRHSAPSPSAAAPAHMPPSWM